MEARKIAELRAFIKQCEATPAILQDSSLRFFRDYLEKLGAKLPSSAYSKAEGAKIARQMDRQSTFSTIPEMQTQESSFYNVPSQEVPTRSYQNVLINEEGLAIEEERVPSSTIMKGKITKSKKSFRSNALDRLWGDAMVNFFLDMYEEAWVVVKYGNLRTRDWDKIRDDLNEKFSTDFTSQQLKNKLDNLKKNFRNEKQLSDGTSGVPSTWQYYERMKSLLGKTPRINGVLGDYGVPKLGVSSSKENCQTVGVDIETMFSNNRPQFNILDPELGGNGNQEPIHHNPNVGVEDLGLGGGLDNTLTNFPVDNEVRKVEVEASHDIDGDGVANEVRSRMGSGISGRPTKRRKNSYASEGSKVLAGAIDRLGSTLERLQKDKNELLVAINAQRVETKRRQMEQAHEMEKYRMEKAHEMEKHRMEMQLQMFRILGYLNPRNGPPSST